MSEKRQHQFVDEPRKEMVFINLISSLILTDRNCHQSQDNELHPGFNSKFIQKNLRLKLLAETIILFFLVLMSRY